MNQKSASPRYREIQRWSDVWVVMVIVASVAVVLWFAFIKQMALGVPISSYMAADWLLVIMWLAFGVGLPVLAYWLRMVVEVYPDKIVIDYRPLPAKTILMLNVVTVEPRVFSALPAFAGWPRRGSEEMRHFNVSARTSLQLVLRDRTRLSIGTHAPDQLAAAISAARNDVKK